MRPADDAQQCAARLGVVHADKLQHERDCVEYLPADRLPAPVEHEKRDEEHDEHVDRQVGRVAEGRVGARARLRRGSKSEPLKDLEERDDTLHGARGDREIEEPLPQILG